MTHIGFAAWSCSVSFGQRNSSRWHAVFRIDASIRRALLGRTPAKCSPLPRKSFVFQKTAAQRSFYISSRSLSISASAAPVSAPPQATVPSDVGSARVRTSRINVIEVLRERGLLQAVTHEDIGQRLNVDEAVTVYAGFDPTADSLHLGNLVAIMALAHFQRAGHRPIAVVGGATGLIGDPSGRKTERDLISNETIERNLRGIQENLCRFLVFDSSPLPDGNTAEAAKIVNNMSWYEDKNVVQFIREVGKHFRLSSMLAKDSVRIRLEEGHGQDDDGSAGGGGGMSFTEFTYQIFQAYDFMHLCRSESCKVQLGGSDQWGNITAGTDLIRRMMPGTEAFGVTLPLLTTASGEKFGKSAGNAVWLDEAKTSCYDMFQYFLRTEDADVGRFLKVFTFLSLGEIDQIVNEHMQEPEKRIGQRILAEHVVRLIHGQAGVDKAKRATEVLFGQGDVRQLSGAEVLSVFKDVPSVELSASQVIGSDVLSLAVAAKICSSKGEARRLIQNGGYYMNNGKVDSADMKVSGEDAIDGKVLLLRSGKKNYRVVRLV
mmetsp:Transcript_52406/g.87120  ORF Transcript_52406/g.87120 Transcript_52406/m.87120 type:complete len:546 (+) Transcript_52406:53-1690(+)